MFRHIKLWAVAAAMVFLAGIFIFTQNGPSPALAATAPKQGILRVQLEIDAVQEWTNDHGESRTEKIKEAHTMEIKLYSAGDLKTVNTLDSNRYQQMAEAAAIEKKIQQQMSGGGMSQGAMPDMTKMKDMQKKVQACAGNQACLQKAAMEMSMQNMAQRGPGGTQAAADIQAMSMDCTNIQGHAMGSAGYQTCMENLARKRSMIQTTDSGTEKTDEPRYQYYTAYNDKKCSFSGHSKIDRTAKSISADVGGMVEGSDYTKGEADVDQNQSGLICGGQTVVDVKNNRLYSQNVRFLPIAVQTEHKGGGNPTDHRTENVGHYSFPGLDKELQAFLTGVPLNSSDKVPVETPEGGQAEPVKSFTKNHGEGGGKTVITGTAKLKWSFVPG